MKNWKYIKVGNYDAQEKLGLKPVQGEIEKEVYSVYAQTGKDKEKTKRELKAKHPHLDEQWLDKMLSKLVGNEFVTKASLQKALREQEQLLKDAEKMLRTKLDPEEKTEWQMAKEDAKKQIERIKEKIGNESIFKQEASLFEGLKKDAEKEIGNADTVSEYNAEIQRLTKKAEQLRRMGQGKSAMEIEKQIEKLGKEMREAVGNETKGERKFGKVMGEFEEGALKTTQGKTVTDPAQAKAIAYSEADKVDNLKRARNAMNKKVGNLDHVEEGDYVSVRYQGEIVDGVVRKIQGTQALVTIDGTDMWFPIRSLKEST